MIPTDNTTTEYELTYLARELPAEIHSTVPHRIIDIYVPDDRTVAPHLRLRRKDDEYEITKKLPVSDDRSVQTEQTIPLDLHEFESLISGGNRTIEKDRYVVTIDGHQAEVDVFSGDLSGLVLIDFEFANEADKAAFTPPACCLAEVTQETFIAGGNLAGKAYRDIAEDLSHFGYTDITV